LDPSIYRPRVAPRSGGQILQMRARPDRGLGAILQSELTQNGFHMHLHRRLGDDELARDDLVRGAFGEGSQDRHLSAREADARVAGSTVLRRVQLLNRGQALTHRGHALRRHDWLTVEIARRGRPPIYAVTTADRKRGGCGEIAGLLSSSGSSLSEGHLVKLGMRHGLAEHNQLQGLDELIAGNVLAQKPTGA